MTPTKSLSTILPQLYTCIVLANDDLSHIPRGLPQDEAEPVKRVTKEDKAEAKKQRNKANYGLNMLHMKPEHLSGDALFDYQFVFR